MDKILVLEFGGQYNQLIARHVRSKQVRYRQAEKSDKIGYGRVIDWKE